MYLHIVIALWNKDACTGGLSFFSRLGGLGNILEVTGSVVPLYFHAYTLPHIAHHNPKPRRFDPVPVSRKS